MPFAMHQPARMASTFQRARIVRLANAKLRFPEPILAKLDLFSSLEAKRLIEHLFALPDLEGGDGDDAA